MRSLVFVVILKGNFEWNYDDAQAQRPKQRGSENKWMKHHVVEFMEKVFHLSADDGCVALLFVLSDIIVVMGCLVIELKTLVEWFLSSLLLLSSRDGFFLNVQLWKAKYEINLL